MPLSISRRKALQAAGSSLIFAFTGCSTGAEVGNSPKKNSKKSPAESLASSSPTSTSAPLSTDDFSFHIGVLGQFTDDHPARLRISFSNTSDGLLVGLGGPEYILPFVDEDFVGTNQAGEPKLLLLPDNERYFEFGNESGNYRDLSEVIPQRPIDGCWKLPIDWPPGIIARTELSGQVKLKPKESVEHRYSLYYLDTCTTGQFSFEGTVTIAKGSYDNKFLLTLGFDMTITESGISVSTHEPTIGSK